MTNFIFAEMNASNCQLLISFANFQAKCVNKQIVPALIYSFGLHNPKKYITGIKNKVISDSRIFMLVQNIKKNLDFI